MIPPLTLLDRFMPYSVQFTPEAARQLRALRTFERVKIADQCLRILSGNPTLTSKARIKRLRDDVFPPYRLRVDDYRVFYDVEEEVKIVMIYAVIDKSEASEWITTQQERKRHENDDDQ
jgi:mRNA-degrading endonuclease RelE of RelBE toxin-antitoxin system